MLPCLNSVSLNVIYRYACTVNYIFVALRCMLEKSSEYIYIRYCLFEVVAIVYVNTESLLYKDAVYRGVIMNSCDLSQMSLLKIGPRTL